MKNGEVLLPDKLLRKREVAERLACSLRTVEREANVGRLTRVKVRGGVRFRESQVQKSALNDDELWRLKEGSDWRGLVYFTAARTGLRQEELRQLIWDDVRLDEGVPYVRVRMVCAKNKKEELVPLVPEICEALKGYRPVDCLPQDLVFPRGVPQAKRCEPI